MCIMFTEINVSDSHNITITNYIAILFIKTFKSTLPYDFSMVAEQVYKLLTV